MGLLKSLYVSFRYASRAGSSILLRLLHEEQEQVEVGYEVRVIGDYDSTFLFLCIFFGPKSTYTFLGAVRFASLKPTKPNNT